MNPNVQLFYLTALLTSVTFGCSKPPATGLRMLSGADSAAVINFRDGVEHSVPLNTSEAQSILKAAGAGKLVARNSRGRELSWATSFLIRFRKGTNTLGEIPFYSDEFWMADAVYRDDTGEFPRIQSKLSVAKPFTNAPTR